MSGSVPDRLRPIASRQNGLLKELRRAFSQDRLTEDGYCAIESVRLVEEAIRSGLKFKAVFFGTSAGDHAHRLLPQLASQVDALVVADKVLAAVTATHTPQGVAALVKLHASSLEQMLAAALPLLVVVAGVQDPGNLGTIMRSSEAFGATGVVVARGSVSPFNQKAIRASAGSLFRLPLAQTDGPKALLPALRARGVRLVATSSHKGTPLPLAQLTDALAIFAGNEGAGLSRDWLRELDETIAVPHSPRVESLNAGVALSIVLYEISRRRQFPPGQQL
jgi:TrmH family RNA methyltransferase